MRRKHLIGRMAPVVCLALVLAGQSPVSADVVLNGGFEAGFLGWTKADEAGSDGSFFIQTGTTSPVNGFTVPAPPGGTNAAMTDAGAPGSHVLYQDFVVPTGTKDARVSFSLFLNNGGSDFFSANTLDFTARNSNGTEIIIQQARVDLVKAGSDPFSLAAGDVLQNLYQTQPGDPLVSGYNRFLVDASSVFAANAGQTIRLRFSETDNLLFLNLGVDNVSIATSIPEPSVLLTSLLGGAVLMGWKAWRRG